MELPVEHGLLMENLLDLAHAPFTHTTTFAKGWPVPRYVERPISYVAFTFEFLDYLLSVVGYRIQKLCSPPTNITDQNLSQDATFLFFVFTSFTKLYMIANQFHSHIKYVVIEILLTYFVINKPYDGNQQLG